MIDIFVQMPGASAKEVEQRVTQPMEKLLWEIPGVEYIYSTSSPGTSMAVVRFFVGEDEEKSIVRLQSKLMSNMDRIPGGVTPPLIKPRYIDDVPVLALTLWLGLDHYTLRRVAAEAENLIKREPNVSITQLIGGEPRRLEVRLDPVRLAAYQVDASQGCGYSRRCQPFNGLRQLSIPGGTSHHPCRWVLANQRRCARCSFRSPQWSAGLRT